MIFLHARISRILLRKRVYLKVFSTIYFISAFSFKSHFCKKLRFKAIWKMFTNYKINIIVYNCFEKLLIFKELYCFQFISLFSLYIFLFPLFNLYLLLFLSQNNFLSKNFQEYFLNNSFSKTIYLSSIFFKNSFERRAFLKIHCKEFTL